MSAEVKIKAGRMPNGEPWVLTHVASCAMCGEPATQTVLYGYILSTATRWDDGSRARAIARPEVTISTSRTTSVWCARWTSSQSANTPEPTMLDNPPTK